MTARREVTAAGHRPDVWAQTLRRAPAFRLPRRLAGVTVLVAAAHADDETLGAGGLIAALRSRGARFVLVVATDGAAAFPGLGAARRSELADARRREAHAALTRLGVTRPVAHFLDLPDGEATGRQAEITARLGEFGAGAALWLAPWRRDPHPDHRAVGAAAAEAVRRLGERPQLVEYPVWMRHGMTPRDPAVCRETLRVLRLGRGQRIRKQRAIRAHTSQITVWDDAYEPVLPPSVTTLFTGAAEPLFVSAR